MFDTTNQDAAQAQGWKLVTTVENGTTHPLWDIVRHGGRFTADADAFRAVMDAASRGSAYHREALALVTGSRAQNRKKR